MLGIILSEPIEIIISVILAGTAIVSAFVTVSMYRKTLKDDLAKQKDLDQTNIKVMNNECDIKQLKEKKATYEYVDKEIRGVNHRVDEIKEDVSYLRTKSDKIYDILIQMQGK